MKSLCFWGDTHPAQLPEPRLIQKLTGGAPLICNLEAPLTTRALLGAKATHLCADPAGVNRLNGAGVVAVHLANNHILDAGDAGLRDTCLHLRSRQIQYVGILDDLGKSVDARFEWVEVQIALVGYGEYCRPPLACLDEAAMVARVRELRGTADRLIVSIHWGIEYVHTPSPDQRRIARRLLKAGADLVVGHHPHVAGVIEYTEHGAIAYSLGNASLWVSEAEGYPASRLGLQLKYDLIKGTLSFETLLLGDRPAQLWYSASEHTPAGASGRPGWNAYLREAGPVYLRSQANGWRRRFRKYGLGQLGPLLRWFVSRMFLRMAWGCILAVPRERDRRG